MRKTWLLFCLSVSALLHPKAIRADGCHCENYRSLAAVGRLGLSLGTPALSLFHNEGGAFHETAEDRDRARRILADAEALIPSECRARLGLGISPRGIPVLRETIGDTLDPYTRSSEAPDRYLGAYRALVNLFPPDCAPLADHPTDDQRTAYRQCLARERPAAYRRFTRAFNKKTPEQILREAATLGEGNPLAGFSAADVGLLKTYHRLLNSGSEDAVLRYLRAHRSELTTEQRLTLVQMFGARFRNGYDYERLNGENGRGAGIVTFDQMLRAARHNTEIGFHDDNAEDPLAGAAAFEGVCRDIASAQGKMFEALGFRNTYVVSHATAKGSYHVTVVTQDPTESSRVYRLDYGDRHNAAAGDSRALFAGPNDASINYRVFRPGGRSVATVSSEFGKFLQEAAGFDVRALDPLARVHGTMAASDGALTPDRTAQVRLGVGSDGIGARYVFVGGSYSYGDRSWLPGRVGLVLGSQNRPGEAFGNPESRSVDMDFVYAQLEQRFRTPDAQISPSVRARIEAAATSIFMAGRMRNGQNEGEVTVQGDLRIAAGLRVDQSAWRNRFTATYRAGVQASPGLSDVRNNEAQVPAFALDHLYLSAEGRVRLSGTPEGRAFLIAATTVLVSELGARGRAELGIATDSFGATAFVEGRLTDESAPFLDGSERRAGIGAYWNPSNVVRLTLTGTAPLEEGSASGPGATGNLLLRY